MSKSRINYQDELILSLKRENSLLRRIKLPVFICKSSEADIKKFLEDVNKPGQIFTDQSKSSNDEATPRDFTKPDWKTFHFGDEDHELATADENGVLVFRDAIFEAPFDRSDDCTNVYDNSTLKKELEEWFDKNAPQVLKDNYTVDLLNDYEIFDEDQLPEEYRIGKQLTIFKDWHNRIKGVKGERYSTWWWTKTAYRGYVSSAIRVDSTGNRNSYYAYDTYGVVPCLRPIKRSDQ